MGEGGSDDHSVLFYFPYHHVNSMPDCRFRDGESYCRVMTRELSK